MSNLVELDNVGKLYGTIIALKGVTTNVNRRSFPDPQLRSFNG